MLKTIVSHNKDLLMLRVVELRSQDVGRTLCRMHPEDMARIDCREGDLVTLEGSRRSAARTATADASSIPGVIALDGILRENTGAGIGEQVRVGIGEAQPASSVTLVPSSATSSMLQEETQEEGLMTRLFVRLRRTGRNEKVGEDIRNYRRLVDGVPVVTGGRIRVTLFGRPFDFKVAATVPDGVVQFHESTEITIMGGSRLRPAGAAVSYDDIGGLGREVARVREMVELPLRYPELFEQLGVDPPKGLLLHGPPGCGKTLIARAVARETGVFFINVNGPEIIQQHYGESEQRLRSIFEAAQEHPTAIIFFDEIDALAPNRDTVQGDVEKRVVAQLLALMDGISSRGRIIVMAATNLPNNVDPALRRPGRFDREIAINPPDKNGRLEILTIHSRGMPLAEDVQMERVAAMTHGFLGADLAALCREAAMVCLREYMPHLEFSHARLTEEEIAEIRVGMKHFDTALNEIELSTTRQVTTEMGEVRWRDVGGLEKVKQTLREAVESPLRYGERFAYAQVRPPKGILLTGVPGTGKTLIAKAMATESEVNFISVKGPELLSKWVGESERGIREVFKKARQSAPSILFFDEIDAIVPSRGSGEGNAQIGERMVGQFLLEMDSLEDVPGVLVLAATNRPDLMDRALFRPGRFDMVLTLPMPDYATRLAILEIYCQGRRLAEDVTLTKLAEKTEGMTGAALGALCQRGAMLAIRESIEREPDKQFSFFALEQRHLEEALEEIIQSYSPLP